MSNRSSQFMYEQRWRAERADAHDPANFALPEPPVAADDTTPLYPCLCLVCADRCPRKARRSEPMCDACAEGRHAL